MFLKRKVGVTERARSLNLSKGKENGHMPYHCSFWYLARALCMTWHVNLRAQ